MVRVAHFDCFSGISGDMTLGALIDAGVDAEAIDAGIASLGLPIQFRHTREKRGGFIATRVHIEAPEAHAHRHLPEIEAILDRGKLSERQRDLAFRIFRRLAEAEATVHGMPLEKVHFHEVGALDSIADIAGAAIGLDLLGVEGFTSRPVSTGFGMVQCAHGLMPIPTPGTAELLKNVPLGRSVIEAELTTPTGAAILTSVVSAYVDPPEMTIERIGYGAGKRDFPQQPNILRLLVGSTPAVTEHDQVWVIETNLDDCTPEIIGYCFDQLLGAGALDVYTIPIQMKKQRPGMMLGVLAEDAYLATIEAILFRETGTFGVRKYRAERSKRQRSIAEVNTPWGPVRVKHGWRDGQGHLVTPEYEDCARLAQQHQVPLREIYAAVQRASQEAKEVAGGAG